MRYEIYTIGNQWSLPLVNLFRIPAVHLGSIQVKTLTRSYVKIQGFFFPSLPRPRLCTPPPNPATPYKLREREKKPVQGN